VTIASLPDKLIIFSPTSKSFSIPKLQIFCPGTLQWVF
jgi:hypothetical protein